LSIAPTVTGRHQRCTLAGKDHGLSIQPSRIALANQAESGTTDAIRFGAQREDLPLSRFHVRFRPQRFVRLAISLSCSA
jgi:hypothetical protein